MPFHTFRVRRSVFRGQQVVCGGRVVQSPGAGAAGFTSDHTRDKGQVMSVSKEIGRTVRTAITGRHRTGRLIAILAVVGAVVVIVALINHGGISLTIG